MRARGINTAVGLRLTRRQLTRLRKANARSRLLLLAPKRAPVCQASSSATCAVEAANASAAKVGRRRGVDLVVVTLPGPRAVLNLPSRGVRVLAIVPLLRGRFNAPLWRRAIERAAESPSIDLGVAPVGPLGMKRLGWYLIVLGGARSGGGGPPAAPSGLAVSEVTQSSMRLSWQPAADKQSVVSYGLYRDGASVGPSLATSAAFTGLACSRGYLLEVDAVDDAGNRSARAGERAATAACAAGSPPPSPPPALPPPGRLPDTRIDAKPPVVTRSRDAVFRFSADELGASFECSLDGAVFRSCVSPASYSSLTDGHHTFAVRARNALGLVDPTPPSHAWDIDRRAPETEITSGPNGAVSQTSATFEFAASEPGTFECSADDGPWRACTSPVAYSSLDQGQHTFAVRASDRVGNVDATPAERTWKTDTVPPQTSVVSGPSGLTNAKAATFTFSATESATFECRLDDGGFAACASPFTYSPVADGSHTFRVRAKDAAGNLDPSSANRSWMVDGTPPETMLTAGPSGSTSSTSATLEFASSETGTFQCRLDAASWASCTSPATRSGLADGAHTFAVRARDGAGNTDPTEAIRGWIVDTVAPQTTIAGGPSGRTNQAAATFMFAPDEPATLECQLDAAAFAPCSSPKTYSGLGEGAHTFRLRATDAAGNSATVPRTWTVDITAPETTITAGPSGMTQATSATFEFASSESGSFECRLDGAGWTTCASPSSYTALAARSHTFDVRASDVAGNVDGSPATRGWTVGSSPAPPPPPPRPPSPPPPPDTAPPETAIDSGPSGATDQGTVTFTFSASEPATFSCSFDAGAFATCSSPRSYTGLADGQHAFSVHATDGAGNVDPTPASRTWTVDATAPQTTITAGPSGTAQQTAASFEFGANEASTFECRLDGGAWSGCESPRAYQALLPGSHTFEVRATDTVGNVDSSPAARTWSISAPPPLPPPPPPPADTDPPETTIDSGPSEATSSNSATFAFSADEVGSGFECAVDGVAFTLCVSPAAYSGLLDGVREFEVRARDGAGNVDPTPAARTWTIDTTDPVTTITAGPSGTVEATDATFAFTANEPGTFECSLDGAAYATCSSPKSYAGLAVGGHNFRVRTTDGVGNLGTRARRDWTIAGASPPPPPPLPPPPPPPPPPAGSAFYVSASGSDSNPGTLSSPWRTVQKAVDTLQPSQIAYVRAGNYGEMRCSSGDGGTATGGSVTIAAYPGERPVLSGPYDGIINISCAYLRIQGFLIDGPSVVGGTNVYANVGSHHVDLVGNEIRNSVCQGIAVEPSAHHWLIARNRIHDNGHGCDQQAHGIYLQGDDHLVENNVIYSHAEGYGIQGYPNGHRNVIAQNTIVRSGRGGIVLGGGNYDQAKVVNNVLASNAGYGVHWNASEPTNCLVARNIVFGPGAGGIEGGTPAGCAIRDNLLSDPLFVSLPLFDLHVLFGSPAIDRADPEYVYGPDLDGTARPQGAAADIGAYER